MSYNYKSIQYYKRKINVDSRARDPLKYPNINKFQMRLDGEDIQEVQYIKLLDAQIPKTQYNVNEINNGFSLIENEVQYDIEIPICNYSLSELITVVENLLNGLGTANTYTVSEECNKLKFEADGPFQLLFATGCFADKIVQGSDQTRSEICKVKSARNILGFGIKDYTSDSSNIIMAPFVPDLTGEPYILLELETTRDIVDITTPCSSTTNGVFFKIPLMVNYGEIEFFKNDYQYMKVFNAVLKDLKFLNIRFKTYYGEYYNFNGRNVSFTLEIGTLK